MSNVKVKLNSKGVRALLKSQEMMNVCTKQAYTAQSKLGDGYEVSYKTYETRAVASIEATTPKTIKENLRHNTILKALKG